MIVMEILQILPRRKIYHDSVALSWKWKEEDKDLVAYDMCFTNRKSALNDDN
jgi:hypothetical protein